MCIEPYLLVLLNSSVFEKKTLLDRVTPKYAKSLTISKSNIIVEKITSVQT